LRIPFKMDEIDCYEPIKKEKKHSTKKEKV
jgi:hypothetical protein